MLRITRFTGTHAIQTIKLEGKLLRPWIDEVRKLWAGVSTHGLQEAMKKTVKNGAGNDWRELKKSDLSRKQ